MNQNDALFLQTYGEGIASNIVLCTVQTLFYGFYLILIPLSTYMLLRNKNRTKAIWIMFSLTILLFFITSVYWATFVATNIMLVRIGLVDHPEMMLLDCFQIASKAVEGLMRYQEWPQILNLIIGDVLLTWRVWALFPLSKIARYSTLCLLIANICLSIASSVILTRLAQQSNLPGQSYGPLDIRLAALCFSLAINCLATGLIAFKAYIHRRQLQVSDLARRISQVERILNYIIESGIVFICLQVLIIVLHSLNLVTASRADVAKRSISQAVVIITAAYPSLLIIVVNSRRTISDATEWHANTVASSTDTETGVLTTLTHLSFGQGFASTDSQDFTTPEISPVSEKRHSSESDRSHRASTI